MSEQVPEGPAPNAKAGRIVYGLRIVLVRLRFIALLLVVVLVVGYWDSIKAHVERWFHSPSATAAKVAKGIEFYCPMHPWIVRDEMGKCPICGMPLSERKKSEKTALPEGVLARVQLSPFRVAQAGIRTALIDWRPLERQVSTVGFIEYDERKLSRIAARFPGRVESMAVDFTGTAVERGKPLASIYSPEVVAAEESFLSALQAQHEAEAAPTPDPEGIVRAKSLTDAARTRLLRWGLLDEQLAAIEREGKARTTIDVLAPMSGIVTKKSVVTGDYVEEGASLFDVADLSVVWLKARVYEDDLGLVANGRKLTATSSAFPGKSFEGTVAFLDPFVDKATRTAGLRADLSNADGQLRPGMYMIATILVPLADVEPFRSMPKPPPGKSRTVYVCEMHDPPIVCDEPGDCAKCEGMPLVKKEIPGGPGPNDVLAVPESAVVDTGARRVVYVESAPGVYDAREVVLGARAGDFYPVIRGLDPGMKVAAAGSFLIDAETRLNPAAAGTYFGATGAPAAADPPPGHR